MANAKWSCPRGDFIVGSVHWLVVSGDDGSDAPPRWAGSPNPKRIIFLAAEPGPADAAAWYEKYQKDHTTPASFPNGFTYALGVTDGDRRLIYRIFSAVPDDARLVAAMKAAVVGSSRPIAIFNVKTGAADLSGLPK